MTELTFTDSTLPKDEAPPGAYEYACETCGKELFYGGKGRKPKFCDEHKTAAKSRTGGGSNSGLARQAAAALSQWNSFIALGLMLPAVPVLGDNPAYLPRTASAIAAADEGFTEAAYNALLTDPKLCKLILKTGSAGGKIALVMAYGMLVASVAPVGIEEYRERKDGVSP